MGKPMLAFLVLNRMVIDKVLKRKLHAKCRWICLTYIIIYKVLKRSGQAPGVC